jgi:geranylgeranyl diphosphate synthase type 3
LKKRCVALLEKFGSFSYTTKTFESLNVEARAEVAKPGGNPLLKSVLGEMLIWKGWKY